MVAAIVLSSQQHKKLHGGSMSADSKLSQLNAHLHRLMIRHRSERNVCSYFTEEQAQMPVSTHEKKRVHFDVDENDTVRSTEHQIEPVPDDRKHLVYSSRKETRQF